MKSIVYERGGGSAGAGRFLALPVLICFFTLLIHNSSAGQKIELSYDPAAMTDTFFTKERLAYPWYVLVREDGTATEFPNDDTVIDITSPEYRKRPVSGKCVILGNSDGHSYSDTAWTVMDYALLKDDTLVMEFTFQQPPYIDAIYFRICNGKIAHRFDLSPSIMPLSKKDEEEYPAHLKLVSVDIILNQRAYKKGDMLFAKMEFTLLDTWSKSPDNTTRYEGWLRCKVQ